MSVKIMSLIFDADIPDLDYEKDGEKRIAKASTVKLILLAYADHANDEGEAAYPGYTRLELKTALSRQGIADTLEAVRQHGFMVHTGVSKRQTGIYEFNLKKLEGLVKPLDQSSHLTSIGQAALPALVKPLDLNHPLSIIEPSTIAPAAPAAENQEPPKPSPLEPSTPWGIKLLATLKREAEARRGGPVRGFTKFPTMACKDKFEEAEKRIGAQMEHAIKRAMQIGCTSVPRAVDYVAKWGTNGKQTPQLILPEYDYEALRKKAISEGL